jgi:hypothetical protein
VRAGGDCSTTTPKASPPRMGGPRCRHQDRSPSREFVEHKHKSTLVALTSKPSAPITPRAKRLASVFDKQGIRGDDQKNGEDGYGYGYEHQDLVRGNSCAHMALDIQQRCDPKKAQRKDHDALHKVRESCPDSYHGCPSLSPAPFSYLYSPKCVEGCSQKFRCWSMDRTWDQERRRTCLRRPQRAPTRTLPRSSPLDLYL